MRDWMLLFWGAPNQKTCRVIPQQCRTLFVLYAFLCSPLAHSALLLGVSPGDSCLETYQMEIARGAEADLPLETMLEQELLAFQHSTPDLSEITWYQCDADNVSMVYYGAWFNSGAEQKRFFENHRAKLERKFGQPSFDAFDLGWMAKLVLWLDGKEDITEKLTLVQWQPENSGMIMLGYSRLNVHGKAYGVTMSWER
ncbi:hypothetical protein A3754_17105 [Alcanivorax sp. HI0083]|nr:hypothetical protein A3730_05695 [Alcanivorax sp. HI0044]KZZ24200.1 hypothetical protein A3754_17105 [Alcanivorax sp. HI0083]